MLDPTSPISNELIVWSEVARNFGILMAGILGVGIAWWRSRAANLQARAALEQSELARRDHITEIFNRAVGQLGDQKLEVRLGAIYTLRAICEDPRYSADMWLIVETLSAFLRECGATADGEQAPVDIRAITDLLRDMVGR